MDTSRKQRAGIRFSDGARGDRDPSISQNRLEQAAKARAVTAAVSGGEWRDGELVGCVGLLGKRGSGKSTEMARLLRSASGRLIVFDTVNQYSQGDLPGCAVIHDVATFKAFIRSHLAARSFRILYQPIGDVRAHFDSITAFFSMQSSPGRYLVGRLIFAIDEVDRFCSPSWMRPGLDFLVNCGRHPKIALVWTSRRPQRIARDLSSQTSEFRVFFMSEPKDRANLAEYIGDEAADHLNRIPRFHYLRYRDGEPGFSIEISGRRIG